MSHDYIPERNLAMPASGARTCKQSSSKHHAALSMGFSGPSFRNLAAHLTAYLAEITEKLIRDEVHGEMRKAEGVDEPRRRARFLRTSAPTSIDGIEKYLGSGMIRGIGSVYAKKMVQAFGEKVFDIIEAEPDRLREVTGIGLVRAKRITDAWAEQKIIREIMFFLHSNGVGTARAVRILKPMALMPFRS